MNSVSYNSNFYNSNSNIVTKKKLLDNTHKIDHLYIKDSMGFENSNKNRYEKIKFDVEIEIEKNYAEYLTEDEKKRRYRNEEDEIYCGRFPHLNYCGCNLPCSLVLNKISPIQLSDGIYVCSIEAAFKTKELLNFKITHILNVSCTSYNQRKYFKYLDIFVADNHTENAIKYFKISNRFIEDAINKGGKVLLHSVNGRNRCWVFVVAFLIGKLKMKYVTALEFVRERFPWAEPNENFLTQLKHYDLETNV